MQSHNGTLEFMEEDDDDSLRASKQGTRDRVAIGSGSCRDVTHPTTLPTGVKIDPDFTGNHFHGAGGEVI